MSGLEINQNHELDIMDPLSVFQEDLEHSVTNSLTNKKELGRSYYKLGKIHYDKADLALAEKYFLRAQELTEFPQDVFAQLKIYGFLIRIYSEGLNQSKALEYIAKTEDVVEKLTTVLGSLNSEYFYNLGVVKNYRGLFKEASENFALAYKKSREENEPDLQAKTLLALANSYFTQGEYEESFKYLQLLEQLLEIIDKSYLKGSMFYFLGKTYSELGQYEKAINSLSKAMHFFQLKKSWNLHGYILLGKGMIYKKLGEYDKSLMYYKLAMDFNDPNTFRRLDGMVRKEVQDVNDSSIDIYLDRINRKIIERQLGTIDFKHRFVLLEILFLLAKNPGKFYDKDHLAKEIWKDEYNPLIHDKLIYTSVSRLRKLIEPKNGKGEKRKYIVRGKDGYTFNPRVKIRFHLEGQPNQVENIGNIDLNVPV